MIFNTLQFIPFLAVVLILHRLLPWKGDKIFLLIASLVFYASFDPPFVILLVVQSVVDYFLAIRIYRAEDPRRRKTWLILSLISNLGLLGYFKYTDFLVANLNAALSILGVELRYPGLGLVLPVGISFYTFHTLSYTIDIYRRKLKPAPFFDFLLFVSFFTQLVAGPIVRAAHMLPQLARRVKRLPSMRMVGLGIWLVTLGFTKKIVFADNLAGYVGGVFQNPRIYDDIERGMALLGFSWQIYCDFSGYSDIAIGLCLIMGFHLKRNFNLPYLARGFSDFWRRWHISLSSWVRDYLFIPLGGSRESGLRTAFNLLLTMSLCGLWHGASWMFVTWGFLHGLCLVAERRYTGWLDSCGGRLGRWTVHRDGMGYVLLSTAVTFFVVTAIWAFFRGQSMSDALLFAHSFVKLPGLILAGKVGYWRDEWWYILLPMLIHVGILARRLFFSRREIHWAAYGFAGALMLFLVTVSWESTNVFIYFQF